MTDIGQKRSFIHPKRMAYGLREQLISRPHPTMPVTKRICYGTE